MTDLEGIYRAIAIENLTSKHTRYAGDAKVEVVEGGAWVTGQTFIPDSWPASGHRIEPREFWEAAQPGTTREQYQNTPGEFVITLGEEDFAFSDDPISLIRMVFPNL